MPENGKVHIFKFVKANDFKTVGISGVTGALNIKGQINMNFYVDTIDIINNYSHEINSNGTIGKEIENHNSESTSLREIPFAINVDIPTAKVMIQWMQILINEYEIKSAQIASDTTGTMKKNKKDL